MQVAKTLLIVPECRGLVTVSNAKVRPKPAERPLFRLAAR